MEQVDGGTQRVDRIPLARHIERRISPPLDATTSLGEHRGAADADEGEARIGPAVLSGLQEEGARPLLGELAVQAHRRLPVGEKSTHDRDHASARSELAEAFEIRSRAAGRREREAPGDAIAHEFSPPASRGVKQVRAPVWHATPV